ncbi:MAG: invasin domain 3-containing protein [Candidatus Eisenbacteria bacterium]
MSTIGTGRHLLPKILILSGLILLWIGCQDEGSIAPFEPTPLPDAFLNSLSANPSMLGLGGREAELRAFVVDTDGNPAPGVEVKFKADIGNVGATAITDTAGIATVVFQSGSEKGTATVVASIGSFELTTSILIGANELTVNKTSALADGRSEIDVSVTVYKVDGHPAALIPITFAATVGTIPVQAVTDSSGFVRVRLTGPASKTDIQAEISATVEGGDIGITDGTGDPDADQVVGVALVTFRGITLALTSDDADLVASGFDSTVVRCLVAETVSRVPVQGLEVAFGTDLGSIESSARTGQNGVAEAALVSGIYAGTAHLVAFVETLSDSTTVEFTPLKLEPLKATPRSVLVGGNLSTISTRILNQSNNPVKGLEVRFKTDKGVIPGQAITDAMGQVAVALTSGDTAGVATVQAWFGSLSVHTDVEFRQAVAEPIRLTGIVITPSRLVADGISQATVSTRLLNESNNPVVGGIVEFATDLGVIAEWDSTDEQGVAEVWLTSVYSEDTVTAHVSASHGSLTVADSIHFLPPATKVPNSLILSPDTTSIQVAGLGGMEGIVLTAIAFDAAGDTVMGNWDVTYRILSGPGGGEYLTWPDSGAGDEVTVPITNGRSRITLTAGVINGIVNVQASIGTIKATGQVTIDGGPPASAVIGIDSVDNIRFGGGVWLWTVNVIVRDAYGNPVRANTPVYMSLHADSCGSGIPPEDLQIYGGVFTENITNCSPGLPEPGLAYACLAAPHDQWEYFPSFAIEVRSGTNQLLNCLFIDRGGSGDDPANVVLVDVERTNLSVAGVGGEETSQLTFEVRDDQGRPLRGGNHRTVTFQLVSAPAGATLSVASDVTDDFGRVSTSVASGTASGVVKVRATCEGASSNVVNLVVSGGPPDGPTSAWPRRRSTSRAGSSSGSPIRSRPSSTTSTAIRCRRGRRSTSRRTSPASRGPR